MRLDPSEAAAGLSPCCFRRSLPIRSLDCVVRVAPALPAAPLGAPGGQQQPQQQQPCSVLRAASHAVHAPEAWGFEAFLQVSAPYNPIGCFNVQGLVKWVS